jgi:hypothetical protein
MSSSQTFVSVAVPLSLLMADAVEKVDFCLGLLRVKT